MFRLFVILLFAIFAIGGVRTIYPNNSQNIALKPLPLDAEHPGRRHIGDLIFLAAWELGSENEEFGGISALTVLPGGRFIGLSDAGTLIGFGLTSDDRIDRPFITPLPDLKITNPTYRDRDTEGMTRDPDTGQYWVTFEANHAIRRFSSSFARMTGMVALHGKYNWANNKGVEAIARLSDGRFVLIGENLEDGLHEGFLFSGDPLEKGSGRKWFRYRPPSGYRVTDAAQLPDGRLIVLNRMIWFPSGFSAKLATVDPERISEVEIAEGKVIATIAAPLLIDNMEGIAITKDDGETLIWLISDNNFNIFQRTLLMKFRLSERTPTKKPEAVAAPGFNSI